MYESMHLYVLLERTWNKLHEHEDLVGMVVSLQQLKNERTGRTLKQEVLLGHDVALLIDGMDGYEHV